MDRERERESFIEREASAGSHLQSLAASTTLLSTHSIHTISLSPFFREKRNTYLAEFTKISSLLSFWFVFFATFFFFVNSTTLPTVSIISCYVPFLALNIYGFCSVSFLLLLNFFLFLNWFCLWLFYGSISFLILFFYSFSFLPYSVPFLVMMIRFFLVWFPFWLHSFSS